MAFRRFAASPMGMGFGGAMRRLNARYAWSHNDHFIPWVLANLPESRGAALDVGCGLGGLSEAPSPHMDRVLAVDAEADMVRLAARRCAGLPNVTAQQARFAQVDGRWDLIAMIAVLHHLDVRATLRRVPDLVTPGGRLLVVGSAAPRSLADHAWDAASIVTNPLTGYVKHPWPRPESREPPFPVKDPPLSFDELRHIAAEELPGSVMRRHLAFRHTLEWTKPLPR